ncbi:Uncharacterised protein [Mycobacteroides abscessus subsp. massiliense]|nr:Uncharacterised protein [Mycobacteroides abscessus subsp. massiliense]
MHHVGGELTEDPDHARLRDSQRQRAHLREHDGRYPVHGHSGVLGRGGSLSARGVGRDDDGLVPGATKVLQHPQHRVGHSVDVRQERLGDDHDAHIDSMSGSTGS